MRRQQGQAQYPLIRNPRSRPKTPECPTEFLVRVQGPDGKSEATIPIWIPLSIMASSAAKSAGQNEQVAQLIANAVIGHGNSVAWQSGKNNHRTNEEDVIGHVAMAARKASHACQRAGGSPHAVSAIEEAVKGGGALLVPTLNSGKKIRLDGGTPESRNDVDTKNSRRTSSNRRDAYDGERDKEPFNDGLVNNPSFKSKQVSWVDNAGLTLGGNEDDDDDEPRINHVKEIYLDHSRKGQQETNKQKKKPKQKPKQQLQQKPKQKEQKQQKQKEQKQKQQEKKQQQKPEQQPQQKPKPPPSLKQKSTRQSYSARMARQRSDSPSTASFVSEESSEYTEDEGGWFSRFAGDNNEDQTVDTNNHYDEGILGGCMFGNPAQDLQDDTFRPLNLLPQWEARGMAGDASCATGQTRDTRSTIGPLVNLWIPVPREDRDPYAEERELAQRKKAEKEERKREKKNALANQLIALAEKENDDTASYGGTTYAGTSYAGTSFAGTSYAATSYAATSVAGTSVAGTTVAGTTIAGTTVAGTTVAGSANTEGTNEEGENKNAMLLTMAGWGMNAFPFASQDIGQEVVMDKSVASGAYTSYQSESTGSGQPSSAGANSKANNDEPNEKADGEPGIGIEVVNMSIFPDLSFFSHLDADPSVGGPPGVLTKGANASHHSGQGSRGVNGMPSVYGGASTVASYSTGTHSGSEGPRSMTTRTIMSNNGEGGYCNWKCMDDFMPVGDMSYHTGSQSGTEGMSKMETINDDDDDDEESIEESTVKAPTLPTSIPVHLPSLSGRKSGSRSSFQKIKAAFRRMNCVAKRKERRAELSTLDAETTIGDLDVGLELFGWTGYGNNNT